MIGSTSIALFMTIITPEEKAEKVFKTLRLRLSDFVDYDPKLKTKSIVRVTPLGSVRVN